MSNTLPPTRSEKALMRLNSNGGAYKVHGGADATAINAKTLYQRTGDTLEHLDNSGISSPDQRRRGLGKVAVLLAASTAITLGAGGPVIEGFQDSARRIDVNFDAHNLPPGGQPLVYRGGESFEPGAEKVVVVPPVQEQP